MARAMGATRHGNYHLVIKLDQDISSVVNLLVAETPFQEELGCGLGKNTENKLTDLYFQGTAALASSTFLSNYLRWAKGNQGQTAQPCGDKQQKKEQHKENFFDNDISDLVKYDVAIEHEKEEKD